MACGYFAPVTFHIFVFFLFTFIGIHSYTIVMLFKYSLTKKVNILLWNHCDVKKLSKN